jgi:hypothetical protein
MGDVAVPPVAWVSPNGMTSRTLRLRRWDGTSKRGRSIGFRALLDCPRPGPHGHPFTGPKKGPAFSGCWKPFPSADLEVEAGIQPHSDPQKEATAAAGAASRSFRPPSTLMDVPAIRLNSGPRDCRGANGIGGGPAPGSETGVRGPVAPGPGGKMNEPASAGSRRPSSARPCFT